MFRSCLDPHSVSLREYPDSPRATPVRLLAALRNTLSVSLHVPDGYATTRPRMRPRPEIIYVD